MGHQDPNNYWEQLERLEKLIRASEFKAGVIFSFHSLILGLFADRLDMFQPSFQNNGWFAAFTALWLLCVLVSTFYCFKCFMPRIEMKYDDNVFFFLDAVKAFGTTEEYTKKLVEICGSEEALYYQLAQQIHAESKIIAEKFASVHRSLQFFALSFVFAMSGLIIWLVQNIG